MIPRTASFIQVLQGAPDPSLVVTRDRYYFSAIEGNGYPHPIMVLALSLEHAKEIVEQDGYEIVESRL